MQIPIQNAKHSFSCTTWWQQHRWTKSQALLPLEGARTWPSAPTARVLLKALSYKIISPSSGWLNATATYWNKQESRNVVHWCWKGCKDSSYDLLSRKEHQATYSKGTISAQRVHHCHGMADERLSLKKQPNKHTQQNKKTKQQNNNKIVSKQF